MNAMQYQRWLSGLKQKELAEMLGVTPQKLCDWEHHYQEIPSEYSGRLSRLLDWDVREIASFTQWNATQRSR